MLWLYASIVQLCSTSVKVMLFYIFHAYLCILIIGRGCYDKIPPHSYVSINSYQELVICLTQRKGGREKGREF